MKQTKGSYIAVGLLISLLVSGVFELLAMYGGMDFLFERSPSGLKYSFALLPIFLITGAILGYLVWKFKNKKSSE